MSDARQDEQEAFCSSRTTGAHVRGTLLRPRVEFEATWYECARQTLRPEDVDRFDVIVFQRKTMNARLRSSRWQFGGQLTVYEIDDDVWNVARTNPAQAPGHRLRIAAGTMRRACQL